MRKHPKSGKNIWGQEEIADLLKMRNEGKTLNQIGEKYGVSGSTISLIIRREKYRSERAAAARRRLKKIKRWGLYNELYGDDCESFVNSEDQIKPWDYYE